MQKRMCLILSTVVLISTLSGCGGEVTPFTDNSKDADAFALDIKQLVLSTAEEIKGSPQPADGIRVIVVALSELDACPTGNYLKTYQELHQLSSELLKQSENGKPANFQAKLSEISKLANSLPGDVQVEKGGSKD